MKSKEEKLIIARAAYRQIKLAMKDFKSSHSEDIHFCWDECIWVDDEFFSSMEMSTGDIELDSI